MISVPIPKDSVSYINPIRESAFERFLEEGSGYPANCSDIIGRFVSFKP
jgi:hypothetical protein